MLTRATIEVAFYTWNGLGMTGLLNLKSSEIRLFLRFCCVPRAWDFSSGSRFVFSPKQVLGEVLSSLVQG